jgi:diguanylate cyclase (GGDEF)-like protein/PAS domain S-box-containing protein
VAVLVAGAGALAVFRPAGGMLVAAVAIAASCVVVATLLARRQAARLVGPTDTARRTAGGEAQGPAAADTARHVDQLAALLEHTSDLILSVDTEGRILLVNRAWLNTLGHSREEVARLMVWDVLASEEHAEWRQLVGRLLAGARESTVELTLLTREGRRIPVEGSLSLMAGHPPAVHGILRDVSARRRMQAALARSEERHRAIFAEGMGLMCLHDLAGRLLDVNRAAAEALGMPRDDLRGRSLRDVLSPDVRGELRAYLQRMKDEGEVEGVMRVRRADGADRLWSFRCRRLGEGDETLVVGHALDVTEQHAAQAELRRQAHTDPLTGLANRAAVLAALAREVSRAARNRRAVSVLLLELEGFRRLNDEHGSAVGNRVMREVSARLATGFRQIDTIGRLGLSELVVVLADSDRQGALARAQERVTAALAEPLRVDGEGRLELEAVFGLATFPGDGGGADELLAAAESSLAQAREERQRLGAR